ncbi:hypothetical protein CUJ83_13480 [Methanocella sp. CWC-04]|uniref:Carboxypeptidase regulatory-like domain-containing protein n=1 Tax=Methanooceanicella nereidis TaxID=2052831 RepID=A0AAP2W896_9EURY|nr:hypothetical protein [Methanocella sp. CWC-04]MCD1296009.1 hypothetical protein [Methanocella sp. CWC-04]
MSNVKKLFIILIASALLLSASVSMASASSNAVTHEQEPDITVMMGATGGKISGASVYIDDVLAGKTDSNGNFTFEQAPTAGNHTIKIAKKGIEDIVETVDFAHKPVVLKAVPDYPCKNITVSVTDKNTKHGVEGVSVMFGDFVAGQTDANGELKLDNFPPGLYLIKFKAEGYKDSTGLLIVYKDMTWKYVLTPGMSAAEPASGH